MYRIINDNIYSIIDTVNRRRDIEPYITLQSIFQNGSILNNGNYKTIYRSYWQLNAARLSDNFCEHYFQVLEKYRSREDRDINKVVKELYEVSSNSKDKKTLQFSFATKLLHTIDNTRPVYDSLVADFYFLPQIKPTWKFDKKLSAYQKAYEFLQKEHQRIIDNNILSAAISKFRAHFDLPVTYTDQKIIDTLLWKFTSFLRAGAIRESKIKYS
jgi:hypothetical protein